MKLKGREPLECSLLTDKSIEKRFYYFYIARCKDNSLYIGVTSDLNQRIRRHNCGEGALWIKQHGQAKVVYQERYNTYLEVHRRELQVKKWSRIKKEHLIKGIKP